MSVRTVFLYGRPGPHPLHRSLAQAIAPDFVPVDFLIRWYDVKSSHLRRYLSWVACALFFPGRRTYEVFFTDGIQFPPLIMRKLGLLSPQQKVVALLADETLFFLRAGRYPRRSALALKWALNRYDALMCMGQMETELAASFVSDHGPLLLTARSAVLRKRLPGLLRNQPALDANTILFIGNGPSDWRGWYKGIDLLLEAARLMARKQPGLRLRIVGEWDPEYLHRLLARDPEVAQFTDFIDHADDLAPHFAASALYVHLGRGEAFGVSVLEAMCAGVPALVSEWTGAREVVREVDPRLIVPLDSRRVAEGMLWYFSLTPGERLALSAGSRAVASSYTEEAARAVFVDEFRRMLRHFNLPDLALASSSLCEVASE